MLLLLLLGFGGSARRFFGGNCACFARVFLLCFFLKAFAFVLRWEFLLIFMMLQGH